jgi:hypothetical protein
MNRKIIPFIVAFVLVCLVMAVSAVFAFSGAVTAEKFGGDVVWSQPYPTAESMKVINLMGDDADELFIQNTSNVTIYDGSGNVLFSRDYQYPKTTLGDINGDNQEDIIVFYLGDLGYSVDVITNGEVSTLAENLSTGLPARVILMRFASGPQIVLGDADGDLQALSLDGAPLWKTSLGTEEIRGLDDAKINGETFLAAASHNGTVQVIASDGGTVWEQSQERSQGTAAKHPQTRVKIRNFSFCEEVGEVIEDEFRRTTDQRDIRHCRIACSDACTSPSGHCFQVRSNCRHAAALSIVGIFLRLPMDFQIEPTF